MVKPTGIGVDGNHRETRTPHDGTRTPHDGRARHASLDDLFACLASEERRRLLGRLLERAPEDASPDELATAVASGAHGRPPADVTDEQRQRALVALQHTHLPKLVDAGLVEREDGGVALADHPAFEDRGVRDVLEGDASASAASLDALFRGLADARRRTVLDVLSHQFGRIHLDTLARELGAHEQDVAESDVPVDDVEAIRVGLRHAILPHLSDAGLVSYDDEARTVAYGGHPALSVPWMHSVLDQEFRGSLTGEDDPSGVGELEGRDRVVSFGQSLCDRADEELFCMFTDTDLLEAGCLTRLRDASRQGVDVYLGTRDPAIRAYVEENAPEVVLWEPGTDWLNLPVEDDRVGRLLMADREAVMLGTLGEEGEDGFYAEQAMVGEGADNTLVVMIRELLRPHLETVDEETEDVEAHLPL